MTAVSISISVETGASISTPTTLPGADQVRTYGLDELGNWKTTNYTLVGSDDTTTSTTESRTHNYLNEITGVTDTVGSGSPTTIPFTYDKNGNLINDGIRIYKYDAFNRLSYVNAASSDTNLAKYSYDPLNRRMQKIIYNSSGGTTGYGGLTGDIPAGITGYLYDGRQIVEEHNDPAGTWPRSYFWGRYVDELLFFRNVVESETTVYRVLSDLLYRSVALTDTSNNVVEAYDTDAYGSTLCYSGPGTDDEWFTDDDVTTNNPINTTIFTGRQYDPESQIYYYRARYYSPNIGRFISRDPLGSPLTMDGLRSAHSLSPIRESLLRLYFGIKNPTGNDFSRLDPLSREPQRNAELRQGPNLYWYVFDNSANRMDASGLLDPIGGITGVEVGGVAGVVGTALLISTAGPAIGVGFVIGAGIGYAYGSGFLQCEFGNTFDPNHPENLLEGIKALAGALDPIPEGIAPYLPPW